MVAEVASNYDSQWAAINTVAQKLGVGITETVAVGFRSTFHQVCPRGHQEGRALGRGVPTACLSRTSATRRACVTIDAGARAGATRDDAGRATPPRRARMLWA